MKYLVGFLFDLVVSLGVTLVGLNKVHAFYPLVLALIASYYDLFAVIVVQFKLLSLTLG